MFFAPTRRLAALSLRSLSAPPHLIHTSKRYWQHGPWRPISFRQDALCIEYDLIMSIQQSEWMEGNQDSICVGKMSTRRYNEIAAAISVRLDIKEQRGFVGSTSKHQDWFGQGHVLIPILPSVRVCADVVLDELLAKVHDAIHCQL